MARVEADHWWYRGLRDVLGRCLELPEVALPQRPRILDAGCGTGGTLRWLSERYSPSYLGGFDSSSEALALARRGLPSADLYLGDLRDPEVRIDRLDLVVSLDVVCIPGVAETLGGLRRIVERLDRGGRLAIHLPAYAWLFGEHDAAVHIRERYTAPAVRRLLESLDLEVVRLSYRLCALFPAVVVRRLGGKLRLRRRGPKRARSDLHVVPGPRTNRWLLRILALENELIARGVRMPWGSSVFAIGRKR